LDLIVFWGGKYEEQARQKKGGKTWGAADVAETCLLGREEVAQSNFDATIDLSAIETMIKSEIAVATAALRSLGVWFVLVFWSALINIR
jgi:hypothetical protein